MLLYFDTINIATIYDIVKTISLNDRYKYVWIVSKSARKRFYNVLLSCREIHIKKVKIDNLEAFGSEIYFASVRSVPLLKGKCGAYVHKAIVPSLLKIELDDITRFIEKEYHLKLLAIYHNG